MVALAEDRKTLEDLLTEKGVITKEDVATLQRRSLASWIDKVTFAGDFRLREETFYNKQGPGVTPVSDESRLAIKATKNSEILLFDLA